MNIQIKKYENIERDEWRKFVTTIPNGNAFYLPEMVDLYADYKNTKPVVLAAYDDNSTIIGMLIAAIQWNFNGFLSELTKRSIIMGGPLVLNNNEEVAQMLMDAYEDTVKKKAIFSQFRNLFDMKWMDMVFTKYGYKYEEHLDFIHNLKADKDSITTGVDKNKRANVRKTTNKGIVFEEINSHDDYLKCLTLVFGTYKRVGLPCPGLDYFEAAWKHLMPNGYLKTFVARFNDIIIGTRLELVCGVNIYDWYAGADDNFRNKYPNDFIPYNILLWGHDNGYSLFDFGGAGKPGVPYGVREHKKKFGGELVNYGRYEKVHKPMLMQIGKLGLYIIKKLKTSKLMKK